MLCLPPLENAPTRTAAIYRCPAAEAESEFFKRFVDEAEFDSVCIEPKPGPKARSLVKGKLSFVAAKTIDTRANVRWRDATIAFANGRISPQDWLVRTKNLHETVHFLSYPKAPDLRAATGMQTGRAVFAELFVLSLPGRPCFTADDTGSTRYLPGPGGHESWLLAMNDYLGPMLYGRCSDHALVSGPIRVLRADPNPGLLVFQVRSKRVETFYWNNGPKSIVLPKVDLSKMTGIQRGLDLEGRSPALMPTGFFTILG